MKEELQEVVKTTLAKQGFRVTETAGCVDVVAKKDQILLIKVLEDTNAARSPATEEMKTISMQLHAVPLIVARRASQELRDDVVYARANIAVVTARTLEHAVKNQLPYIVSKRSGAYVVVNTKRLHEQREERGMSVNALARKIGVSPRMVARYKEKQCIPVQRAMRIYKLFGESIFEQWNMVASTERGLQKPRSRVSQQYAHLGFQAADTRKAPFDIVAKKEDEIILTRVGDQVKDSLHAMARVIDVSELVLFQKKKPKQSPALRVDEFFELTDGEELMKFVKESREEHI